MTVSRLIVPVGGGVWVAAPTLQGTWVNYGAPYQVPQYRIIGDAVEMRGSVKSGALNSLLLTLPAGFRPPVDVRIPSSDAGTIVIASSGTVTIFAVSNAIHDLSVVRFSVTA